jgi:hypothetical protein
MTSQSVDGIGCAMVAATAIIALFVLWALFGGAL